MLNTPVLIWYKVTQHLGCTVLGWGDRWGTPGVADIDAGERQPGCVESIHPCIVPESVSGRAFLGWTTITGVDKKCTFLFLGHSRAHPRVHLQPLRQRPREQLAPHLSRQDRARRQVHARDHQAAGIRTLVRRSQPFAGLQGWPSSWRVGLVEISPELACLVSFNEDLFFKST